MFKRGERVIDRDDNVGTVDRIIKTDMGPAVFVTVGAEDRCYVPTRTGWPIRNIGVLCWGGFEIGTGTYWEVRREDRQTIVQWVLWKGNKEYSRHSSPQGAHTEYSKHVADKGPDLEASMSR